MNQPNQWTNLTNKPISQVTNQTISLLTTDAWYNDIANYNFPLNALEVFYSV